jgi:serine/threonine protein kinase
MGIRLQGVVHRDLKPENILYESVTQLPAIADFGIASFTEELLVTQVETLPTQRLANFQYAAPEQRIPGSSVSASADIYALGLILNETFTGTVPHGTEYRLIIQISKELGFLDDIVARMLRQAPEERPASIGELKGLVQRHQSEAISIQRLSEINGTVIRTEEVDVPFEPPQLVDFDWSGGTLTLILDRPVTQVARSWPHPLPPPPPAPA